MGGLTFELFRGSPGRTDTREDTSLTTGNRRRFLETVAAGLFGASAAVKVGRGDSAVSAWTGTDTNSLVNQARPMEKGQLKIVKVEPMIMRFRRDE
jgi:hypothetical protein